jgi:hypothetical protein
MNRRYYLVYDIYVQFIGRNMVVPLLRSLVAGLSPWRPRFAPGSIHVGFVVDKVALGQVFLRVRFSPVSISFHRRSPNSSSGECVICNVSRHPRLGTRPNPF